MWSKEPGTHSPGNSIDGGWAAPAPPRELVWLQEAERRRLARELHDDLGQRLAALTWDISSLRCELGKGNKQLATSADQLLSQAKGLVHTLRELSHEWHPVSQVQGEPISTFETRCTSLSQRLGLKTEIVVEDPSSPWPPALALGLFRIVQEGLRNVSQHSGARAASISAKRSEEGLRLTIEDAGRGFNHTVTRQGLGLVSMAERARLLSGELFIDSQPGRGTRLEVRIPRLEVGARGEELTPEPEDEERRRSRRLAYHLPSTQR